MTASSKKDGTRGGTHIHYGLPILSIASTLRRSLARVADALTAPILRLVFGDVAQLGLRRAAAGPFSLIQRRARIPLIDVGTIALVRQERVALRPGVAGLSASSVLLADSTQGAFDAVVLNETN